VFNTQLSWRYDDNEAFGSHDTWSVATGFDLDKYIRITSSYGTAFKAPTFNDLYWPTDAFFKGNPNLKPEESKTFDFGLDISTGQVFWTVNYFNTNIDNLISYVNAYPEISMMENIAKATIDGLEFSVTTDIFNWNVSANASFINPLDDSTGQLLARRSKRNLNISLDSHTGSFSYGTSIIASSARFNKTGEQEKLAGFGLMNIRAAYQINKQWKIKAKIDNLFDKDYVLSRQGGYDYYQPGQFIFTSINYRM
jgi:vitamin B12 transporter